MDIFNLVSDLKKYIKMSGKTNSQFGIIVFDIDELRLEDLNLKEGSIINDEPEALSPFGPWFVQTHSWAPVKELVTRRDGSYALDKNGEHIAKSHGHRETICSERWLLGGFTAYLKKYMDAKGAIPKSVTLFSLMTPCSKCNTYMQRFPAGKHEGQSGSSYQIGRWNLAYTKNYDKEYKSASDGDSAASSLTNFGWTVRKGSVS